MTGPRRLAWDEPAPADLFDHLEEPAVTYTLGPNQIRDAARSAQHVSLWAADLLAAIKANDVELAARLQAAMSSHLDHVGAVLGRAKCNAE